MTNSIYHYKARIALREPGRVVRIITVPGKDRNRCTDVEVISLSPPDRWHLKKLSATDDKTGSYRLRRIGPNLTRIDMRFEETWKVPHVADRRRYRNLFNEVWDRYIALMEREFELRSAR